MVVNKMLIMFSLMSPQLQSNSLELSGSAGQPSLIFAPPRGPLPQVVIRTIGLVQGQRRKSVIPYTESDLAIGQPGHGAESRRTIHKLYG